MINAIQFLNNEMETISEHNILKLPIREDVLMEISTKTYAEEEPCIIYRTVITNKLGMEISDRISGNVDPFREYAISEIPEIVDRYVIIPEDTRYLRFLSGRKSQ